MPTDYEAITKHNVLKLGEDTSTRATQVCMYSDPTHFIYELLQNADDYGATEVLFRLDPDKLTVEYNAKPFTQKNVEAITYFGKSTDQDVLVRTGRFGVGFKSVFAFTATPIIISGDEHFMIHKLYQVSDYPRPNDLSESYTRIILPFNHATEHPDYVLDPVSAADAYAKIAAKLARLNMNTLLFTRNIREIRWETDGKTGHYLREDILEDKSRQTTITDGEKANKYLVFARTPAWRAQEYKDVEVAFGVDDKGQIAPIQDYLYVLFATAQETHLQFVINGPYRTNPSRETISEDDHFNVHLMGETCQLLTSLLPTLRDKGLLTVAFLGILPNPKDALRDFYKPLLEAVIKAFTDNKLVPTDDDSFAPASTVLQGPAPIREVVTADELPFLAGHTAAVWAKGVQQNTRPDHFLTGLSIQQWGWSELQQTLDKKYGACVWQVAAADARWLAERNDGWMQKFYILLADALKKDDCNEWTLQRCGIVRVLEGDTHTHVAGTGAYFPKGKAYSGLPQIKKEILRGKSDQHAKKIEQSLMALGVREIGDEERVDLLLETYYGVESPPVSCDQHMEHMRVFIKWWEKENSAEKFTCQNIFRVVDGEALKDGSECYMDAPLSTSGLSCIYDNPKAGADLKFKLWTRYKELSGEGFCDFASACGVISSIPIQRQSCGQHANASTLLKDYNDGNTRFTTSGEDNDYDIPQLNALLKAKDIAINALVWRTMCTADPTVLEAAYRPNQRFELRRDKSTVVLRLSKTAWIPNKKGEFLTPAQMSKADLRIDFKYDNRNGWLDAIGFGEDEKLADEEYQKRKKMAQSLGIRTGIIEQLEDLPPEERIEMQDSFEDMLKKRVAAHRRAQLLKQDALPFHEALPAAFRASGASGTSSQPVSPMQSHNPVRRHEKLAEEMSRELQDEPSPESRFTFGVCKKWKGKDDTVRVKLLKWYSGHCQICGKTFTQHNGEPYFEGLYLVPYTQARWLDRPGNVICLCAWHSAMFQYGTKHVDGDIRNHILGFVPRANGGNSEPILKLLLCGESVEITYHEDHLLELQTMIQESQKGGAKG